MSPFEVDHPESIPTALAAIRRPGARFIGGGTNLVDLMKQGVEAPPLLVDLNRLPLAQIEVRPDGSLVIGALARNADMAAHPAIRTQFPLLAQALLAGASPQLRNLATAGGNILQRTRCHYFYDPVYAECNKRRPGSGCAARTGQNRIHAILGASPACVAVHPSDQCVALVALDADVVLQGPAGERRMPLAQFQRLPGDTPQIDTDIRPDELISALVLPRSPFAAHSHYLKVRDRASYAFALVSVAAALELDGQTVRNARIVLGGVAHRPWRAHESESLLVGRPLAASVLEEAAAAAVVNAQPLEHNGFKVELARRAVRRALERAGAAA